MHPIGLLELYLLLAATGLATGGVVFGIGYLIVRTAIRRVQSRWPEIHRSPEQ